MARPCSSFRAVGTDDLLEQQNGRLPFMGKQGYTFDTHQLLKGWLLERALTIADRLKTLVPPGKQIAYTEMGVTPYFCPNLWFPRLRRSDRLWGCDFARCKARSDRCQRRLYNDGRSRGNLSSRRTQARIPDDRYENSAWHTVF